MTTARIRHAFRFWIWVLLLVLYTVGAGWVLHSGARKLAMHAAQQPLVMLISHAESAPLAHNE